MALRQSTTSRHERRSSTGMGSSLAPWSSGGAEAVKGLCGYAAGQGDSRGEEEWVERFRHGRTSATVNTPSACVGQRHSRACWAR